MGLLISGIGATNKPELGLSATYVEVVQIGESRLKIENKKQDGSKTAHKKNEGSNKTVDLGKGKQTHTLKIYTEDSKNNEELIKIFRQHRFCRITDKFLGALDVYVDDVEVINSDSHINLTIFNITCTIQEADLKPNVNFAVALNSTVKKMEKEVKDKVQQLSKGVNQTDEAGKARTKIDPLTGREGFIDQGLELIRGGVEQIMEVKSDVLSAYKEVKSRIDTAKRLYETIQNVVNFPEQLSELLLNITNDSLTNPTTTSAGAFKANQKTEATPILEPTARGRPLSEVDPTTLSQFEIAEMRKENEAAKIVNQIKIIRDVKLALAGRFNNKIDFDETINAIIKRLEHIGYTEESKTDLIYKLKAYSNQQEHTNIIDIQIEQPKPLVAVVYERYGNLDKYHSIEALNGFKENDWIQGAVKVVG